MSMSPELTKAMNRLTGMRKHGEWLDVKTPADQVNGACDSLEKAREEASKWGDEAYAFEQKLIRVQDAIVKALKELQIKKSHEDVLADLIAAVEVETEDIER